MGTASPQPAAWHAYDSLAELAARESPPQDQVAPLAAAVRQDLKTRHMWPPEADTEPRSEPRSAVPSLTVFAIVWVVALGAATFVASWPLVAAFLAVSVAGFFVELHRRRSERTAHVLAEGIACPACSYDLRGLGDALPVKWVGASCGPKSCPECGEPWPRVRRLVEERR